MTVIFFMMLAERMTSSRCVLDLVSLRRKESLTLSVLLLTFHPTIKHMVIFLSLKPWKGRLTTTDGQRGEESGRGTRRTCELESQVASSWQRSKGTEKGRLIPWGIIPLDYTVRLSIGPRTRSYRYNICGRFDTFGGICAVFVLHVGAMTSDCVTICRKKIKRSLRQRKE